MGEEQKEKNFREQDEERRIKDVAHFAEWEGRRLWKENQVLSQNPFYQPSETTKNIFLQRIKRYT